MVKETLTELGQWVVCGSASLSRYVNNYNKSLTKVPALQLYQTVIPKNVQFEQNLIFC
jgi:hypothetical protein